MKEKIQESLLKVLGDLYNNDEFNIDDYVINIQDNKEKEHGDLASNIALILAKPLKRAPKEIASEIKDNFLTDEEIIKVDVAGPGFINFYLSKKSHGLVLKEIHDKKERFGKITANKKKVLIEYVSSNPTGPLHVGHGRGAVFGSVLSSLLKEAGFEVDEEYYVNDFGRQMNILAASLWIRYAQIFNSEIKMIKNGYQGEYLISIAESLKKIGEFSYAKNCPVIHISTDYVFGGEGIGPFHPNDEKFPVNEYGRSKSLGEDNILKENSNSHNHENNTFILLHRDMKT